MMEAVLFGGLVVLDPLAQRAFWRLLLVTPVTLTAICLILPGRRPHRSALAWVLGLYALLWAAFLLSHLAVFAGTGSGKITSVIKGLLEYVLFPFWYSRYRDWRTVFLMLSGSVLSIEANAVATLLIGPGRSYAAHNVLNGLLFALLLAYFVRFQRRAIWTCMEDQEAGWFKFCSIPTLVGGVLLLFRCFPEPTATTVHNPVGTVVVILLQPTVYQVLFDALNAQRERARLEENAALLRVQVHMIEEQERQMEHRSRLESVARHDRRHLQTLLLAHLDAGDIDGARAVLREQLSNGGKAPASFCEDPVLNQLLAYFDRWAKEEQIRLQIKARLSGGQVSRRTDVMIALCNVLENAVHACRRVPDPARREIRVVLHTKGEQIYLSVSNAYEGELVLDPATGLPRTERPGHGYGFQSIAAIAGAPPVCSAEHGRFSIRMLL